MSLTEMPNLDLEPSEAMKAIFRRTVMAAYGRRPKSAHIEALIDRNSFSVNIETIVEGVPGKRMAIDRWVPWIPRAN